MQPNGPGSSIAGADKPTRAKLRKSPPSVTTIASGPIASCTAASTRFGCKRPSLPGGALAIVRAVTRLGAELGLSPEETAFYTALAENGSARELMRVEDLRVLARQLVAQIRRSRTIDWTRKESVRAKMRLEVRKLLARYGYPPDLQKAAIDLVIHQAEHLADDDAWS